MPYLTIQLTLKTPADAQLLQDHMVAQGWKVHRVICVLIIYPVSYAHMYQTMRALEQTMARVLKM